MNEMEILPREAKQCLDHGVRLLLVDVREPRVPALCHIGDAVRMSTGSIPANLWKLDTDEDVICFCHHGVRSLDAAKWRRAQGVKSTGGTYACEIQLLSKTHVNHVPQSKRSLARGKNAI